MKVARCNPRKHPSRQGWDPLCNTKSCKVSNIVILDKLCLHKLNSQHYDMCPIVGTFNIYFLVDGVDWKLFHYVSNCKSQSLSFQVSISELRCKSRKRSKWRNLFFFWSHRPSQTCSQWNLEWCLYLEHIFQSHCNICCFWWLFLVTSLAMYHSNVGDQ